MLKLFRRALLAVTAILAVSATASAQQMPPIPVDTAVRIGKLPNGLTYYIRHNEKPKGQADFYIAQKVGSVLEEDNQRGLAHFLEHMCFNGTDNFPGHGLRDWLESIGVKFGYNLNAYTSFDETVYNISNVPVARKSVQDSCLLILHDWANALTLDPEEIDNERGVIHEEWRRSMQGQMRILENLLPVLYPDNRYGYRLPIGTMEVVDNFPPQALRDYYETWYRPDQQGVVVVGDIDVDYIEGKIKEMFSDIEMPENAKERVYFEVADNPGTIYAIGSDPEQKFGVVEFAFKTDPIPTEMKGNSIYLLQKYMTDIVATMLNQRLNDIANTPDAPFAQASSEYGQFLISKTKDALTLMAVAKGDELLTPFEAVYRELLRAARGGFTVGEYKRASEEFLSRLEKAYNGRDARESEGYVREYVRHFIDNEPIPSIEDEYEFYKMIVPMLPIEAINQILPQLITADNRALLALVPGNDTFKMPTEEEFAAVVAKVDAEEIEPYKDTMKEEPLIPALPAPGKVISRTTDAQWGAEVLTLSNGIKVYVKPTDFKKDEIIMNAIALGGTSSVGDEHANSLIMLPYANMQSGLGEYTNTDLQKYLQGKQASVSVSLDEYNREVSGESTVKDLPIMMELLYMTFVDYTINEDEFSALQNMLAGVLSNQEVDPSYQFQKFLAESLYSSAASQAISTEVVKNANREDILSIIHDNLANAADYTFYFVGDIDMETFIPLVEQYIATLPTNAPANSAVVINSAREIKTGNTNDEKTYKMETPQTWCAYLLTAKIPYTSKNAKVASVAGQILSNRLLNKIREEMGAVYSIGASARISRQDDNNTILQIAFPMKPELKKEVLAEIDKMIKDMIENVTADELNPIKEFMVKSAIEAKDNNSDWLNAMVGASLNGVDTFNNSIDELNSITINDVMAFMKSLLEQDGTHIVILDPAE